MTKRNNKLTPNYDIYTAIISQSGTGDPTVTVLENTFSAALVWTRSGVGSYVATLAGAFDTAATFATAAQPGAGVSTIFDHDIGLTINSIILSTINSLGASDDGLLNKTPVEIRVYN